MRISKNFRLSELIHSSTAEANRINNYPSNDDKENLIKLVNNILQPIRDKYGKPIYITSGYRSPILNRLVKGVPTSHHVSGNAVDITTYNNKENKKLFELIVSMIENNEIKVGELIDEKSYSWIHISNPMKEINEILHIK